MVIKQRLKDILATAYDEDVEKKSTESTLCSRHMWILKWSFLTPVQRATLFNISAVSKPYSGTQCSSFMMYTTNWWSDASMVVAETW